MIDIFPLRPSIQQEDRKENAPTGQDQEQLVSNMVKEVVEQGGRRVVKGLYPIWLI